VGGGFNNISIGHRSVHRPLPSNATSVVIYWLYILCVCLLADKASTRIGALQHLGEKGDKLTAMLVQVREILPKYRSGALPKVFKVLPKFEAWEEVRDNL